MADSKTRWWMHVLLIGWTFTLVAWIAEAITQHAAIWVAIAILILAGTMRSLQKGVKFGDTWLAILASLAVVLLALPTVGWLCFKIGATEVNWFTQGVDWLRMHG